MIRSRDVKFLENTFQHDCDKDDTEELKTMLTPTHESYIPDLFADSGSSDVEEELPCYVV